MTTQTTFAGNVSRRTLLRAFALAAPVAAAATLLPGVASAGDTVTTVPVPGGTIELIDATSMTLNTNGGYTKPDESNTGVPAGTKLTVYRGDIVVTLPGTVIENLDIYGFIKVRAANVVIRRCKIRGSGPGTTHTGLVDCNHTAVRNTLIEDCTLVPDYPSIWLTGVIGKEYTARRNNVWNCVDGFGAYNASVRTDPTNVTIESNYIHDLAWFSNDYPNHADGTHNDGIQVQGGANVSIRGNNIQCFMSATAGSQDYVARNIGQGILIQPNTAPIRNVDVSYNWLDGGKVGIYMVLGNQSASCYGKMEGNRFGRNFYQFNGGGDYQIRLKTGITFTNDITTNCWDDNDVKFSVGKWQGIRYDV